MTFDEALDCAAAMAGAEAATHYGQPAAKANGHAFLNVGHEPAPSFVLHLEPGVIEWLIAAHPETFWTTPHYEGHAAVLVRYDSDDEDLVREMIASAHARALAKPPKRPRR